MAADTAYKRAEQRIERARRDGATKLDLNRMGLTEVPEAIGQLRQLQLLYLRNNSLSSLPEAIGQLGQLRYIYLDNNKISSLPAALLQLGQLRYIYLDNNGISSLPKEIGQLRQLRYLYLRNNSISSLPEAIGELSQLRYLYLDNNFISSLPEGLGQLSGLQDLNLSNNSISSLPEGLGQLSGLQVLNLSNNSISSLPEGLGQLSGLQVLNLYRNSISSLPEGLAELSGLQRLNLFNNPLNPELAAAHEQGTAVVLQYLRSIARSQQVKLNEAKLILVGEGEVGKTSLLGALCGDEWVEDRPTTHGIEIKSFTVKVPGSDTEIKLNGWDFGGQPVYRPTHQLFFSAPAVYLVVWKPREGPQQGFIEYWITLIKRRAPEAKIIIVATHGGPNQRQPDIDRYDIVHRFGRNTIEGFFLVDSKPDATENHIDDLKDAIARVAASLPEVGRKVPAIWQQVREKLQDTEKAYLSYDQIIELCAKREMNRSEADLFLLLSHTLGHLIHYHHDPLLQNIVILKPDWLAKAISFVLDDRVTRKRQGLVDFSRLNLLWNNPDRKETERYPEELHEIFRKLMERFDLSYRVVDPSSREPSNTSLIAQLVSDSRPDILPDWGEAPETGDEEQQLICCIVDEQGTAANAEGLFYQLIVRLHKYSLGRADHIKSIHWKRGLLLDDDYNGRALLEYRGTDLWITVRAPFPEFFIQELTKEVKWLVEHFWRGLRCQVMVPCIAPCGQNQPGTGRFEVEKLIESKREGRDEYPCNVSGCDKWQNIEALLRNAPSPPASLVAIEAQLTEKLQDLSRELARQKDQLRQGFQQLSRNQWVMLSQSDLQFTRFQQMLVDEAKDGPRLFSFQPIEPGFFDFPKWVSRKYKLTLWCEHSRLPLPALNPEGDKRGVYELYFPRGWLVKAKPFLKLMTTTLTLVLPVAGAATKVVLDEAAYAAIEAELELGKGTLETIKEGGSQMLDIPDDALEWEDPDRAVRAEGGMLRELHAILKEKDPTFGGLMRLQNKRREFLWVHPRFQHEDEYS